MAFVNEMISDESIKKYNLEEFEWNYFVFRRESEGFPISRLKKKQLTVDHERSIWLRFLENPRETNQSVWAFFWHGQLLIFTFSVEGVFDASTSTGWKNYRLLKIELPFWLRSGSEKYSNISTPEPEIYLPEEIKSHLPDIYCDLKEALIAYKSLHAVESKDVLYRQDSFSF